MTKSTGKRPFRERAGPIEDRLKNNSVVSDDGCIKWLGQLSEGGYGIIAYRGRPYGVHQVAWLLKHGSLPEEPDVIDHKCKNRPCFNVEHLRILTRGENTLDGVSSNMETMRTGVCKRGHKLEGENLFISEGRRRCRVCRNTKAMEWYYSRQTDSVG